ncbi:MAG: YheU family protein [Pseudomonadales bacterium]|nr:YheU family protein [Pseudomonadales bacterium]
MAHLIIPPDSLSSATLNGIVEEFVTREGTDYGHGTISLETKVAQVLRQLRSGEVVIVYDSDLESVSLTPKQGLQVPD